MTQILRDKDPALIFWLESIRHLTGAPSTAHRLAVGKPTVGFLAP